MMESMPGVQDVFCGPETIVHVKSGAPAVSPEAIAKALTAFEIEVEEVARDDSAML